MDSNTNNSITQEHHAFPVNVIDGSGDKMVSISCSK